MNKQRIAILIVAGLGALGTFMPWVKVPIVGSISGTKGDGWITFALFAVPIIISLINDKSKSLKGGLLIAAVLPGLAAGIIGIWKILDFNSKISEMSNLEDNPFAQAIEATVSIEFGLYLIVLTGILLPLVALIIKDNSDELEEVEEN